MPIFVFIPGFSPTASWYRENPVVSCFLSQVNAMNSPLVDPPDLELFQRIGHLGVIAVLIIDDSRDAVPLALALSEGGVGAIELTLRTDAAIESVQKIRDEVPQMTVGVGTILRPEQVERVIEAGGHFGVAPGFNPRTVRAARDAGLPFAPGVCTPSDVELALEAGCTRLKFFPCEPCGGLPYLRSLAAPFAHLGVRFIPLGGVDASNAETYLMEPLILAIGGSWLAPREIVREKAWDEVTRRSKVAIEAVSRARTSDR